MRSFGVLTWNLGRLYLGARLNAWLGHDSRTDDGALAHVARVVHASGAELIAVQELRSDEQLERLRERLGSPWRIVSAARTVDRVLGFLSRAGRGASPISSTLTLGGGRTAATLVDPLLELRAIAVHLDPLDAAERASQCRELLRWIDEEQDTTTVVAGDLNMDPSHLLVGRASDRRILRALVADRGFVDGGAALGPTAALRRRLDYVLVRGRRILDAAVLRGRRVPLGDHDPLLLRIQVPRSLSKAVP